MMDFLLTIVEKILDWLISLSIKPKIKIINISIGDVPYSNKKHVSFEAIISNNSNRSMSVSEKYLRFYNGKKEFKKIPVTKYQIVRIRDGFDEWNSLTPIDDIILLNPGESKKVSIIDEMDNPKTPFNIFFTYYTGRRTYYHSLNINK